MSFYSHFALVRREDRQALVEYYAELENLAKKGFVPYSDNLLVRVENNPDGGVSENVIAKPEAPRTVEAAWVNKCYDLHEILVRGKSYGGVVSNYPFVIFTLKELCERFNEYVAEFAPSSDRCSQVLRAYADLIDAVEDMYVEEDLLDADAVLVVYTFG